VGMCVTGLKKDLPVQHRGAAQVGPFSDYTSLAQSYAGMLPL
jgi:hypothetical protein